MLAERLGERLTSADKVWEMKLTLADSSGERYVNLFCNEPVRCPTMAYLQKIPTTIGILCKYKCVKCYLSSTFAPAASSFFFASSAADLFTPVNTSFGADSTKVLAS